MVHNPDQCLLGRTPATVANHFFEEIIDVERILATKLHQDRMVPTGPGWTLVNDACKFQVYLNNVQGCCTFATVGNLTIAQSAGATVITDDDVETGYEAVTAKEGAGFSPGPPPVNDNGCNENDVLDYWQLTGVGAAGKIAGHAGVQIDPVHLAAAAQVFGGLYLGGELAVEQQNQEIWDYVTGSRPGSWGGHAFPEVGFNITPEGYLQVVTWGAVKYMTVSFLEHQVDEAHVIITPAWLEKNANNPAVNQAALQAALAKDEPES